MRAVEAIIQARRGIHPLKLIRIWKGLNRNQLQKMSGVWRSSIQQIEHYKKVPYTSTRYVLLDALGIDRDGHEKIFGPPLSRRGVGGRKGPCPARGKRRA